MKQFLLRAKEAAASLLSRGGGVRLAAGAFRCYLQPRSCCDRFRCLSSIAGSQPLSHGKYIGAACELGNPPAELPCGKSIRQRRQTFFGRADGKEGGAPSKGNEECQSLTKLRLCADGGADRVFDEMPDLFPHEEAAAIRNKYKPDVIKGDMDSVRTEVLDYYIKLGTEVVDGSHDQETTDFHKCVSFILDFTPCVDKSKLCILVAGGLGGRFDHEVGNINVLCCFKDTRIILLSDDCLIHLLPKAQNHVIHILSSVVGPHCGLIPIGKPSKNTTTRGLQWDLNETEMKFGGLVSTSNIANKETVTVHSDSDLLWTISTKKP